MGLGGWGIRAWGFRAWGFRVCRIQGLGCRVHGFFSDLRHNNGNIQSMGGGSDSSFAFETQMYVCTYVYAYAYIYMYVFGGVFLCECEI